MVPIASYPACSATDYVNVLLVKPGFVCKCEHWLQMAKDFVRIFQWIISKQLKEENINYEGSLVSISKLSNVCPHKCPVGGHRRGRQQANPSLGFNDPQYIRKRFYHLSGCSNLGLFAHESIDTTWELLLRPIYRTFTRELFCNKS